MHNTKPQATAGFAAGSGLSWLAAILTAGSAIVVAQEAPLPDKSAYTLFNPTPDKFMRQLAPDRPDKTDSPFTVDAGHFEIEMDYANLTYNQPNSQRGNVQSTSYEVAPMNLKVGLLNSLDFQLVFTPYESQTAKDRTAGTTEHTSGFNGITPRFKLNLVGNDGGLFALALLPFVKLPLSSGNVGNNSVEGGLGIPFAFDIPGWDVGFQTSFLYNRDSAGSGYHTEFDNSVSVGHSLIGKLGIAAEFFSSVSTETGSAWVGTFDTWLTYQINKNLRLDGGVYIGVTPAADDWHPWLGMTARF
jgi:hypothetical protein